ncbi:alpha/beta fold hydrolase [Pararhodobacter zhoushanensis]|uniref:Maspardin n=1 Tax=Pararhodobacter zhoushanensis TaxID=2479545 RepID=A0ABT3GZS5_9RHOB|nr:alpha/beta hydrolase [Pararhodobacter zhoushanensis]MCW1933042.1 alpha/beta hydrolase [Pararhodobacter zhoushanensis]
MSNTLMAERDAFLARHPETRLTLDGRDWGLIDTGGTGDVFLFLPGTLGRADVFFKVIEPVAAHMRVLAVSYPESGGVVDWAASLISLLDQLGVAKVSLLGSSLGGFVAQYFAATYPERVSHLFAANTLHSLAGIGERPPYSSDLWTAPIDELRRGFAMGLTAWADAHPDQREVIDFLLAEAAGRIPEMEMRARLDALKTGPVLPPLSNTADTATTIESLDDPLIPAPMRAAVRERNAPGHSYRFLWGGHFPYLVRGDVYANLLLSRLGRVPMGGEWAENDGVFEA